MIVIPHIPYNTKSRAEYRVFDMLRESFEGIPNIYAFHSINITNHSVKRFAEADFLVISEYGLFVLEVKGGRVRTENGVWFSIDARNNEHKIQNPFRQANSALHAITKELLNNEEFSQLNIPIGYGVIFPNIAWTAKSTEWDNETICDAKKFRNFEGWLKQLFDYWTNKTANRQKLLPRFVERLKQYLRPNFEFAIPLHLVLSELENARIKFTEDQYQFLDIASANKRVLCFGGAGTGKTLLAIELAKRFANSGNKVVVVCKSSWLKRYLEVHIMHTNVVVSTIASAIIDKKRAHIDQYDVLIVDEGQDIFDYDDMGILIEILKDSLSDGRWYVFYDVNNQSGFYGNTEEELLDFLRAQKPAQIPLTTNCRNTNVILTKVQDTLQLDMGTRGTGQGPKIKELTASNNEVELLEESINELLSDGIAPSLITILSPFPFEKSSVFKLPDSIKNRILQLDDYAIRRFPPTKISFAEIKNFKGLENEAIIVIDLIAPKHLKSKAKKCEHYVAMSRAKALLCVIWVNEHE